MLLVDEDVWDGPLAGDFLEGILHVRSIGYNLISMMLMRGAGVKLTLVVELDNVDLGLVLDLLGQERLGGLAVWAIGLGEDHYLDCKYLCLCLTILHAVRSNLLIGYWSISPWTLVLAAAAISGFRGVEEKNLARKDVLGEILQLKLLRL